MNTGAPSRSAAIAEPCAAMNLSSSARSSADDPAAEREARRARSRSAGRIRRASRSFSTSSCSAPTTPTIAGEPSCGRKTCTTPSSRHLLQRLAQLLRLHGVAELDAAQDLRREARHAAEQDVLALGQRVADAQRAVVGDADDVAGEGLVGDGAVAGRRRTAAPCRLIGLPVRTSFAFMPRVSRPEQTRMKAMRSRWFGSMLAWILNTKPVIVGSRRPRPGACRPPAPRGGGAKSASASSRSRTPKLLQRRAEEHRRQMAFAEGLEVERPAGLLRRARSPRARPRARAPAAAPRRAGSSGPLTGDRRLVGVEPAHDGCGARS